MTVGIKGWAGLRNGPLLYYGHKKAKTIIIL